jgi:hypothetical protein
LTVPVLTVFPPDPNGMEQRGFGFNRWKDRINHLITSGSELPSKGVDTIRPDKII